jgi:iron-regulated transporter 1
MYRAGRTPLGSLPPARAGCAVGAAAACATATLPTLARLRLQASHFLSTWGQRGWEFCVGLIMLELRPASLLLVAVWGLLDAGAAVAFGAAVGRYVDSRPRLAAASRMYLLQNAALAVSAAAALGLLWGGVRGGAAFWVLLALTMGPGMASTLGALGSSLSGKQQLGGIPCPDGSRSHAHSSPSSSSQTWDETCAAGPP